MPRPTVERGKKKVSKSELQALTQEMEDESTEGELSDSELYQVLISGPNSAGPKSRPTTTTKGNDKIPSLAPELSKCWADRVMAEHEADRTKNEGIKLKQNPNFTLLFEPLLADATEVTFSDEELDEGVN